MITNTRTSVFLVYAVLLSLFCLQSAATSLAKGKIVVKPHIETGWQRDSNFHKSETNTQTVDTYFIKPGLKLGYSTGKSIVSFDYWFNVKEYNDQDDVPVGQLEADDFDFTEHQIDFLAQTQATERLLIGVDNKFIKSRDPANSDTYSNAVDRFKYNLNKFTPRLTYNFADKFGVGLAYTNLLTDYADDGPGEGEDSDENRGTVTLFYYFMPNTSFDFDYQFWTRDYDKTTSDYTSNQVMLNVNQLFHYFTVSAGIGYHDRDFDQASAGDDIDIFAWKLSIAGKNPPEATGIPKSSMYISLSSNMNDSGFGNSYYSSTKLEAKFTHLFAEKINCSVGGWFQNADYETFDREDDRWLLSLAADYLINDFFTLGVEGGVEERDSDIAGKDFDNEYILIKLNFNYDFGSR